MSTEYDWDTRCADVELARLQRGFTRYDHMNFSRVLLAGYARVQADVHVRTGRLRQSGKAEVNDSGSYHWSGEISFGGNGVRWAASEFFGYSPKHGGYPSHQYFKRLGWLPTSRSVGADGGVPWTQGPIRDVPGGTGRGVPIEDDMLGPVTSFISRGRRTVHPELAA